MSASYEVTALLRRWSNGDQQAVEDLAGCVCMQNSSNLLQVNEEGPPISYAAADGSQRPPGAQFRSNLPSKVRYKFPEANDMLGNN